MLDESESIDAAAVSAMLANEGAAAQFTASAAAQLSSLLGADAVADGSLTNYLLVLLTHKRALPQVRNAMHEVLEAEGVTSALMAWLAAYLAALTPGSGGGGGGALQ